MSDHAKLKLAAEAVSSADEWYSSKTIAAFPEYENDTDFVIAASPSVVLGLIAENESTYKHWVNASNNVQAIMAQLIAITTERDRLKIENSKLINENQMLRDGRPVHIKEFYKFPEKLLKTRLEKGLSQRQLSALAGMSCPAISNYETGKTRPGMKNVLRLEAALDCPGAFQGDSNE